METITKRSHKRRELKTPITHSMYKGGAESKLLTLGFYDNRHEGVTGNISPEGLYFESDIPCWEQGPVYITLTDALRRLMVSDDRDTISGRVVWCRENVNPGPLFRIGVKLDDEFIVDNYTKEFGALWLS